MGSNSVKAIVLLMALVVLSVCIGSQVSGGVKDSAGSFVIIGAIALSFFALIQGKGLWKWLYFGPAIVLPSYSVASFSVPYSYVFSAIVLGYALLMWVMGYVKFRWRPALLPDLLVLFFVGVMVANYIRYPVDGIGGISMDAEYVGGREYVWCLAALLYYVAISSMSGSPKEIEETVKKTFYFFCAAQMMYIVAGATGRMNMAGEDGNMDVRYGYLAPLGLAIVYFFYSKYSMLAIVTSIKRLFFGLLGTGMVVVAGNREPLVGLVEVVGVLAIVKRETVAIFMLAAALYGVLFVASSEHLLIRAPFSVQRVLSVVPGMEINSYIRMTTEGSSETRRDIWKMAMDPHAGYIKDYVWGDGFQTSTAMLSRASVAAMRRVRARSTKDFNESLAKSANWHNGALTTINRIGAVGLFLVILFFVCGLTILLQIWRAYEHSPLRPYFMAVCLPFAYTSLTYLWGTQVIVNFIISWQFFGIIKLLYCAAREQGRLRPLFQREHYVPMMIQELEVVK